MQARGFFTVYLIEILVILSASLCLSFYTAESLTLVYCEFAGSIDAILFGVKSNGYTKVAFVDLLINDISISERYGHCYYEEIEAGELKQLGIYWNWSWGYDYTLTLVTERGARLSITERARPAEDLLTIENVTWDTASGSTFILVKNTDVRMRKIDTVAIYTPSNRAWAFCIVTQDTNIPSGAKLDVNQRFVIILEWPNSWGSSWTSNTTYRFRIEPEIGLGKEFNSTTPL